MQPWSWVEREYLPQPIRYQETLTNQEASTNQVSGNIKLSGSRYYQPLSRGIGWNVSTYLSQPIKYHEILANQLVENINQSVVELGGSCDLSEPIRYQETPANQIGENINWSFVELDGPWVYLPLPTGSRNTPANTLATVCTFYPTALIVTRCFVFGIFTGSLWSQFYYRSHPVFSSFFQTGQAADWPHQLSLRSAPETGAHSGLHC